MPIPVYNTPDELVTLLREYRDILSDQPELFGGMRVSGKTVKMEVITLLDQAADLIESMLDTADEE